MITNVTDKDILIASKSHSTILIDDKGNTLRRDDLYGLNIIRDDSAREKDYSILHPGVRYPIGMTFRGDIRAGSLYHYNASFFRYNEGKGESFSIGITDIPANQ